MSTNPTNALDTLGDLDPNPGQSSSNTLAAFKAHLLANPGLAKRLGPPEDPEVGPVISPVPTVTTKH